MALSPYAFQQEIIEQVLPHDRFALFCDMGTGKSCMILHVVKHRRPQRVLVLSPLITLRNWEREFLLWTDIKPSVLMGSTAAKKAEQVRGPAVVANYEALRIDAVYEALKKYKPDCIICDESHRVKSRTSVTWKRLMRVSGAAQLRYIMTGTPIANDFTDIWAQYMVMDDGATFGNNFFAFRNKYFKNLNASWTGPGAFPKWIFDNQFTPEIQAKLAATSVQIKKEDCIDLPEFVTQRLEVPLSPEQSKVYRDLAREFIAWLEQAPDTPLVVQNALTRIGRLNEIATGFATVGENIVRFKENPRLSRLIEHIQDLGRKTIVFAVYKQNYADITRALEAQGITYVELHGGVSTAQKHRNEEAFNTDPSIRVCLAHPGSAGIGINLKAAPYTIYYSRNYSLTEFEQSRDRNYRLGSVDLHAKITQYQMVAPGTIDSEILERLLSKQAFARSILDIKELVVEK